MGRDAVREHHELVVYGGEECEDEYYGRFAYAGDEQDHHDRERRCGEYHGNGRDDACHLEHEHRKADARTGTRAPLRAHLLVVSFAFFHFALLFLYNRECYVGSQQI